MGIRKTISRALARAASGMLPKSVFSKANFDIWERAGLHVVPNHFYEPVPDTRTLRESLWDWKKRKFAFDFNRESQKALLSLFAQKFQPEWRALMDSVNPLNGRFVRESDSFGPVDREILYGIVRHFKPRTVLEIGSGISTVISARALEKNKLEDGRGGELIAIEPYPAPGLRNGFPGLTRLEPIMAQDIPLSWVEGLKENDVLFIDSSHVCKAGSDVQFLFATLLSAVPQGVLIHFHDIFLPSEYPESWIREHRLFWNEQYLLEAFLAHNPEFEVVWGGSFMHLSEMDALQAAIPWHQPQPHWPGSFWIRRRRAAA